MTITIQNARKMEMKAVGTHYTKGAKPVIDVTTGIIYASGKDASKAIGVNPSCVCRALTSSKNHKTNGHELYFVSEAIEHLDKISEKISKADKPENYDEMKRVFKQRETVLETEKEIENLKTDHANLCKQLKEIEEKISGIQATIALKKAELQQLKEEFWK